MADRIGFEAIRAFAMPFLEIHVAPPKSAGRGSLAALSALSGATTTVDRINIVRAASVPLVGFPRTAGMSHAIEYSA
jgi:hypothetical protein